MRDFGVLLGKNTSKTLDNGPSALFTFLRIHAGVVLLAPDGSFLAVGAPELVDVKDRIVTLAVNAGNAIEVRFVSWAGSGGSRLSFLSLNSLLDFRFRVTGIVDALGSQKSEFIGKLSHEPVEVPIEDLA